MQRQQHLAPAFPLRSWLTFPKPVAPPGRRARRRHLRTRPRPLARAPKGPLAIWVHRNAGGCAAHPVGYQPGMGPGGLRAGGSLRGAPVMAGR